MNIYEIPPEYLMSNYRVGKDGRLFKVSNHGEIKEVKLDKSGNFNYTDDLGTKDKINPNVVSGFYNRALGLYNNRKRLPYPYNNYECKRDGTFYNVKHPLISISHKQYNFIVLTNYETGGRDRINVLETIAKLFVYSIHDSNFFDYRIVTNIGFMTKLTTNHCDIDATYVSRKNVALVKVETYCDAMILVNGLPGHVLDVNTFTVCEGLTGKWLPFYNNGDTDSDRVFVVERYSPNVKHYINMYFKANIDGSFTWISHD